ncbi:hypothetical protein BJY16_006448 [Actinoplanes octamycinicus]|uniref:Uncharacterized protein n=1 Tax=Actinoplanes octamycinicus TaxID=135948 RepID=A0A7W7H2X2_9ACTN|nr:hypothetical protein [Actinoplanes octamycinicus]MBB4742989.1 hypothetical protein [Actinoplanes octamycinicus]GIE58157.1 hypothetical protein Aoc01nite_35590 [Actinoplanes octamycinicus]
MAGSAGLAAVLSFSAWGQFCLARLVSAGFRGMPLRMMSALDEAHARGVLRRAGGVYQFRHNLLQDHLAGRSWRPGPPASLDEHHLDPRRLDG